jgi:hypothetical protein
MAKTSKPSQPSSPPGSEQIAVWARQHRLRYESHPQEEWFRAWEPFDTMVSASAYFNAVSWALVPATFTIAEPWLAPLDSEPLDRTLLGFASHPGFQRWAAARGGDHFNTRVAYLENPPPPRVEIGDPRWDRFVATFAASPAEANAAVPIAARQKLAEWGFSGHLEVRPGGMVVHFAGLQPIPRDYERLLRGIPELVASFFRA